MKFLRLQGYFIGLTWCWNDTVWNFSTQTHQFSQPEDGGSAVLRSVGTLIMRRCRNSTEDNNPNSNHRENPETYVTRWDEWRVKCITVGSQRNNTYICRIRGRTGARYFVTGSDEMQNYVLSVLVWSCAFPGNTYGGRETSIKYQMEYTRQRRWHFVKAVLLCLPFASFIRLASLKINIIF